MQGSHRFRRDPARIRRPAQAARNRLSSRRSRQGVERVQSRTDQVAEALRRTIRQGALQEGAKLPSERAIADEFQVSRTVVREAVARLKSDGLVETRKGAATRVRPKAALSDGTLAMPRSIEGLLGFLEVRAAIEAEMAALAALRRSEAQCRAVAAALRAIDRSTRAGGSGVAEDLAFHLAIGDATSNAYWTAFVRLFAAPMRSAIVVTRANERRRDDFASAVAVEHQRIYDAIASRDPVEARRAVGHHIASAGARIRQADADFWRGEGGVLAELWAAQGLNSTMTATDRIPPRRPPS